MESFLKEFAENKISRRLVPILIGIWVLILYWHPLHLDLWNDEVYSFLRFQRVPLLQTLTDYHETNNHIFFNFLLNIYLRIIGSPSPLQVFQHPEIVRIVPLIFTLISYGVLYRWMSGMLGLWAGLLACVLLTATLPYYNFALQYRAYSLVMMLGMIYGYSLWRYLQSGGTMDLWGIAICSALIFYSHPAGIYLIVALSIAATVFLRSIKTGDKWSQPALYAICSTIAGGVIGGIAYLPVLHQLLSNPWVAGHKISSGQFLRDKFLSCSYQLLCSRYWLFFLAVAGAVLCWMQARNRNDTARQMGQWILYSGIVYGLTFLIPMLRHDDAPQRTFSILIPFLVPGLTIALTGFASLFNKGKYHHSFLLCIALVLVIEIPIRIVARNRHAEALVASGQENASLLNGYYLHHFEPMKIAALAKNLSTKNGLPVYFATAYLQEMPHYLGAVGIIPEEYRTAAQHYAAPDSFYVITTFPAKFIRQHSSEVSCLEIPSPPSFYSLLLVRKLKHPVVSCDFDVALPRNQSLF